MDAAIDTFAAYLRRLMARRKLTPAQLSDRVYRDRKYIDRWLCQRCSVNRRTLMNVAAVLQCSQVQRKRLFVLADDRLMERTR